jgi:serine/threonine-protein kinase
MLGKCFTAKGMLDLALQEFKKLVVDDETKELLYDLAQRYEGKKDLVGAKTVYRQLFAADIDYKDVKTRFEMLSGSTSDPMAFEKTSVVQQMSESAQRRYELLDELGRGAMGIVYRARDKELDEVVALKILPDNMSNNPEAVHRFKIEARNARKLSHPHIVRIHDIGEEMGRKYISMEYVNGSDLKRKVKTEGRFDLRTILHFGIQIADALAYAHRLGIVHRDIKPANIMLTSDNDTKVTDFGIAKMLDQTGEGTMVGAVIGTPLYMSPEQVQGIPVDNRADIYAYGIMMYEFINGRPPFTEGDLAYQHMHKRPERPENCPDELWTIVSKCLEKRKEDRWEKAELIVDALKDARRALAVT